jgi:pimeloyl-ACP methyl ester carboxylesterase
MSGLRIPGDIVTKRGRRLEESVSMAKVTRSDGAEIHWESRGQGPTVAIAHNTLWSFPWVYENLIGELASDREVVVYDPRGCGLSSRRGPFDLETDAGDLEAVIEAAGEAAVVLGVGDGLNRTARVAAARPDLIAAVVAIAPGTAAVFPRAELQGSGVIAASDSVIEMLLQMMSTDPRAALRSLITALNPDFCEAEVRERVDRVADYVSPEAAVGRAHAWLADDLSAVLNGLGDRVSILHGGPDPLFEGALDDRVAALFPDAHVEHLADGPISRPELTAACVRALAAPRSKS